MATTWYYSRQGKHFGPVSSAQLKDMATTGQLLATDMVWKEGAAAWISAGALPDFFAQAGAPQPGVSKEIAGPHRANPVTVSCIAISLSGIAVLLSAASLGLLLFHDPLGKGMKNYDFSSPRAALLSKMKMELNHDFRAFIELESQKGAKKKKEAIATLEVKREADFQGKKLLFVSYKEGGIDKYKIEALEKDAESGIWTHAYVGTYSVKESNRQLAEEMERWEKTGNWQSSR